MSACCFFGHRDAPETVREDLSAAIKELIAKDGVEVFYVGNHGQFDAYVRSVLRQLQVCYPRIRYAVVLTDLTSQTRKYKDYNDTMFPEGIELVHPRYRIDWRNRWMLKHSQFVICYIHHHWGGAAKYMQVAQRQGKTIINLCPDSNV